MIYLKNAGILHLNNLDSQTKQALWIIYRFIDLLFNQSNWYL